VLWKPEEEKILAEFYPTTSSHEIAARKANILSFYIFFILSSQMILG